MKKAIQMMIASGFAGAALMVGASAFAAPSACIIGCSVLCGTELPWGGAERSACEAGCEYGCNY